MPDSVVPVDRALRDALHQDLPPDLGPFVHVGVHPSPVCSFRSGTKPGSGIEQIQGWSGAAVFDRDLHAQVPPFSIMIYTGPLVVEKTTFPLVRGLFSCPDAQGWGISLIISVEFQKSAAGQARFLIQTLQRPFRSSVNQAVLLGSRTNSCREYQSVRFPSRGRLADPYAQARHVADGVSRPDRGQPQLGWALLSGHECPTRTWQCRTRRYGSSRSPRQAPVRDWRDRKYAWRCLLPDRPRRPRDLDLPSMESGA